MAPEEGQLLRPDQGPAVFPSHHCLLIMLQDYLDYHYNHSNLRSLVWDGLDVVWLSSGTGVSQTLAL